MVNLLTGQPEVNQARRHAACTAMGITIIMAMSTVMITDTITTITSMATTMTMITPTTM